MAKGSLRNDARQTFSQPSVRLRNLGEVPSAPATGTLELYFRQTTLYRLEPNGVETPIGGFGSSASPGFTWGRKGNINATGTPNAYLLNDEVPSNQTGRVITFNTPVIRKILVTNSAVSTFTLVIQQHDGITFTDLVTVSLVAERSKTQNVNVLVISGKQLAIKITAGSCSNPVVGVILDGAY